MLIIQIKTSISVFIVAKNGNFQDILCFEKSLNHGLFGVAKKWDFLDNLGIGKNYEIYPGLFIEMH